MTEEAPVTGQGEYVIGYNDEQINVISCDEGSAMKKLACRLIADGSPERDFQFRCNNKYYNIVISIEEPTLVDDADVFFTFISKRIASILQKRFIYKMTYDDVGVCVGLSGSRVSQIIKKKIREMKNPLIERRITKYSDVFIATFSNELFNIITKGVSK